jgi:hypothetical protein
MQTKRNLLKEEAPQPHTFLEFFMWIWIHHAPLIKNDLSKDPLASRGHS